MNRSSFLALTFLSLPILVLADGPADNKADSVRRIPPAGVPVPDDQRAALTAEVEKLGKAIADAAKSPQCKRELLPDVLIFHKAVDWALRYDEFFNPKQIDVAKELLKEGFARAEALGKGNAPWRAAKGLVVQGYRSKIDNSVQAYGLVIPEAGRAAGALHAWFHGRGETLSELDFISQRLHNKGEFSPDDATVLHTYGRYCNGQRFAGETDFFEALADAQKEMGNQPKRPLVVRGFSLGGAACWHIGTHHASKWTVVNPGAGFSDTELFLNKFQGETLQPAWYERKLWNWYDSTTHAANLYNTRTVAYSGEIDKQKQAADLMEAAMAKEGLTLRHIIGPQTGHKYEPKAKEEITAIVKEMQSAPKEAAPKLLKFVTYTLKYDQADWVRVEALREHWEEARVEAKLGDDGVYQLTTKNITQLTLNMPFAIKGISLDGQTIVLKSPQSFAMLDKKWEAPEAKSTALRKVHNLQGPVDDAFMDGFIFVRPTGQPLNPAVGAWVKAEMDRAVIQWRQQYRGDVQIKDDTAITPEDVKSKNLILWGDPSSNKTLAKLAAQLPIQWSAADLKVKDKSYPSATHAAILIYPNPQNPAKYIVLNSGFTFREYDYLNNARQTPKLPDWSIIDITTAPNSRTPGKIVDANFFDEKWQVK
jgi:hypothetical protein